MAHFCYNTNVAGLQTHDPSNFSSWYPSQMNSTLLILFGGPPLLSLDSLIQNKWFCAIVTLHVYLLWSNPLLNPSVHESVVN